MKKVLRNTILFAATLGGDLRAFAADIIIPVNGPVSQRKVMFQCDEHAKTLGLPSGPFTVTYVNGENNWLAVLPMNGHPVIFAGVMSADGSRYAADRFVWWDVGSRGVHLYADGLNKEQTACHVVH